METEEIIVRRVCDGDTIVCRQGKHLERLRLAHIDAPENGQPFCCEARDLLKELVEGKEIQIVWRERDKYGRKLVEIYNCNGEYVNFVMVKRGMAWAKEKTGIDQEFKEAEEQARRGGIGLFADLNPWRPWQWRKKKIKS